MKVPFAFCIFGKYPHHFNENLGKELEKFFIMHCNVVIDKGGIVMIAYSVLMFAAAVLFFGLAVSLIISGIIALLGANASGVIVSIIILLIGMVISFAVIAKVQKKFNGWVLSACLKSSN